MGEEWPRRDGRQTVNDAAGEPVGADFPLDRELATTLLADILATDKFRKAPRQSQLLRYLIDAELNGEGDRVTAYSIAFDVFHRDTSFDPALDSAVRVEMHRLRANLDKWANDPANPRDATRR